MGVYQLEETTKEIKVDVGRELELVVEKTKEKRPYERPMILSHVPFKFETAQSWNPGKGNLNHPGKGNGGINFPSTNPNPVGVGTYNPPPTNPSGNGNGKNK
jgi:hypothetical protein